MKLVIYKPNSDISKGSAFQFSRSKNKRGVPSLFVESTIQSREKPKPGSTESPFDWSNKLTLKGEIAEVGSILATLEGRQTETKLYHKYEREGSQIRTSEFRISPGENGSFGLSLRTTEGESSTNIRTFLNVGEATLLRELCQFIIRDYYNFRMPSRSHQFETTAVGDN